MPAALSITPKLIAQVHDPVTPGEMSETMYRPLKVTPVREVGKVIITNHQIAGFVTRSTKLMNPDIESLIDSVRL